MSRNASFSPVTLPIPLRADRASGFSWKEPSSWGEKTQISWLKVKTMINFLFCSLRLSLRPVKSYYVLRLSPVVYFLFETFPWTYSILLRLLPLKWSYFDREDKNAVFGDSVNEVQHGLVFPRAVSVKHLLGHHLAL